MFSLSLSLSLLISSPTRALAVCTVRAHSSSVFVSHPRDALTTASCRNNWPCTADTQRGSQSLGALMTIHRSQTAACLACHVGSCSSCEVPADAEAAAVICQRRERRRAREREGVRERERDICAVAAQILFCPVVCALRRLRRVGALSLYCLCAVTAHQPSGPNTVLLLKFLPNV